MNFDVRMLRHARMTHTQMMMWTGQMLSGKRPIYNMGFAISIDGALDAELFKKSYAYVTSRSDNLRSVFRYIDGAPKRIVLESEEFDYDVPVVDFSDKPDEAPAWMQAQLQQPIDIKRCLFKAALIKVGVDRFVWFICQHHLVCDGWSIANFIDKVGQRYAQLEENSDEAVELASFEEFVDREITYYESELCQESTRYWERLLENPLPPLSLYDVPADQGTNEFQREHRHISGDLIGRMKSAISGKQFRAFSVDQGLFLLMITALVLQLRRASGNDRFAIGVCLHHRVAPRDKECIGPFFVFSALRVAMEPDDTFQTLYKRVAIEYRNMLRHYRRPVKTPPGQRAWDVAINFVNKSFPYFAGRETSVTWMQSGSYLAQECVGIQIHQFNKGDGMTAEWDFNKGIFGTRERREVAMSDFERAMEFGLRDPDALLVEYWQPGRG